MKKTLLFLLLQAIIPFTAVLADETKVYLDEICLTNTICGSELRGINSSVSGNPLRIGRKSFARGVGVRAPSWIAFDVEGEVYAFEAETGVDDEVLNRGVGSVIFRVYADDNIVANSGLIVSRQPPQHIKVDLRSAKRIILHVSDAGDGNEFDHAAWGEAFFTVKTGTRLQPVTEPLSSQSGILTPLPGEKPKINGARVYGLRPGSPMLFTIPATGKPPLCYGAENLPSSLKVDETSGIISGVVTEPGEYQIILTVTNSVGRAEEEFTLKIGDTLALTPPMGWNSWNCFSDQVSDAKIRQAAELMVSSGLIRYGWSYINIDDFWQRIPISSTQQEQGVSVRDKNGKILPSKNFPNMHELCNYIHSLGLKAGIYSSPGPLTCGGCAGSWQHEKSDIESYADWGFDYLKYDWCTYVRVAGGEQLMHLMLPYQKVAALLQQQPRDIILSICQYGMGHVSAWGRKAGGNSWRTTLDITDTWASVMEIANLQRGLELFAAPGGWNDPDMLVVGVVGWGDPRPTRLTPNQQYSHVSLWCLLNAPLLLGCDLEKMDAFTLNLLTNPEVISVNQDTAGSQATRIVHDEHHEIWIKTMNDNSIVIGVFNRSALTSQIEVKWEKLGLTTPHHLRDLWRQKDLGVFKNSYSATIYGHDVLLLRLVCE